MLLTRRGSTIHEFQVRLLKEYHSFKLIEEVPTAQLPRDRGLLYACVPHGVVPYGIVLLWCELLEKGELLGGLGAPPEELRRRLSSRCHAIASLIAIVSHRALPCPNFWCGA